MRMRTRGLLYHKEASDTSVYYIYLTWPLGYVTRVVAACAVMKQSRCLQPEV